MSEEELAKVMDPRNYVGMAPTMVDEIVKLAGKKVKRG